MESNLLYSKFSDLNVQFNSVAQLFLKRSSPGSSAGKESACNAGDPSSIPGLGRSLREEKGYPLQYCGLENSVDCIAHGVAKELDTVEQISLSVFSQVTRANQPAAW